jgi:hypothetical protein
MALPQAGRKAQHPTDADLEADTDRATGWGDRHSDIYGGLRYTRLEPPAQWELYVVLSVAGAQRAVEQLLESLAYPSAVTVTETPRALRALDKLAERIIDDLDAGGFPGTGWTTAGLNIQTAEVELGIRPFTEHAAKLLRKTYRFVRVHEGQEVREVTGSPSGASNDSG